MSFNPQEVFSSLQSFLGSGYILLIVVAVLSFSFIKKLLSLVVTAAILFVIWFLCQDQIMGLISQLFSFL